MDAVPLALPRVCGVGPGAVAVTLLVATVALAIMRAAVGVHGTCSIFSPAIAAISGSLGPLVVIAGAVIVAVAVAAVGVRGA
jgi:hypothetical protein